MPDPRHPHQPVCRAPRGLLPLPSRVRRGGFTLIELLVVVSLIVLLIAMLLPALGRARSIARKSACASNIKQCQNALIDYTSDYQKWPQPFRDSDIDPATLRERVIWFNAIDEYIGLPVLNYTSSDTSLRNYSPIKQDPVWASNEDIVLNQEGNRTLKMNDHFGNSGGGSFKFYSKSAPKLPGKTVLLIDGRAQDVRPTDSGTAGHFHALEATVGIRHEEGLNAGFADGHVEFVVQEPRLDTAAPSWYADPNPLQTLNWCVDPADPCSHN